MPKPAAKTANRYTLAYRSIKNLFPFDWLEILTCPKVQVNAVHPVMGYEHIGRNGVARSFQRFSTSIEIGRIARRRAGWSRSLSATLFATGTHGDQARLFLSERKTSKMLGRDRSNSSH